MSNIKWTKKALKHLESIGEHIAHDNQKHAEKFVQKLQSGVENLSKNPSMGKAGRVFGTRELVLHDNYIAIYRVKNNIVQILRIQHCAMKPISSLK